MPEPRDTYTVPPNGRPLSEQPRWRRDFPIDWPLDNFVARRDFTKFLVLTSLAFAAGQLWIVVQNFIRRRRGELPVQAVAPLERVPVGGILEFSYPREHDGCLLLRPDEHTLIAFSQKCTHLSCAVVPRTKQNEFYCPCHEGHFDLMSGRPVAGPPRRPLNRIQLQVKNGMVYATGIEIRTV
ncbi:MAG: Rieske 2Fe-2S domain-containing protein [Acidobacteriia bacterium]|nr:Rieske 2Fe-2S domain-containing protein [Terriglobia bacterium]